MWLTGFLVGVLLTLLLLLWMLYLLGVRRRKEVKQQRPPAVHFGVDEIIEELREESDSYLDELSKILSK